MATILIFKDSEAIGEFPGTADADALIGTLPYLKDGIYGVVLDGGVIAHSADLPRDNPWYRKNALQVERSK